MRFAHTPGSLLRAWVASGVLLAGVAACGNDRAETGSSQDDQAGAATLADTGVAAARSALIDRDTSNSDTTSGTAPAARQPVTKNKRAPDTSVSGYQAMGRDSAVPADTVLVGDSAEVGKTGERLEPTQSSEQANADTLTTQTESDRVRPPEDSTETLGNVTGGDSTAPGGDTTVTGSAEMARDTSTTPAQADTVAEVEVDTSTTMDQETEVAVETPADTAVIVGDSTEANTDTLAAETERVRPPEDSTEVLGNVTTQEDRANQEADVAADQAPAGAAGAQTSGPMLTGAEAVAQVTREGQRCAVVEAEESEEDIRWDLASSPATMNPCGTGTMTLPRIQTEE